MIRIFFISYLRSQIMSVFLISFDKPNYRKKTKKKKEQKSCDFPVCVCVSDYLRDCALRLGLSNRFIPRGCRGSSEEVSHKQPGRGFA